MKKIDKRLLATYTMEHCEQLLRDDPDGCNRLYAIAMKENTVEHRQKVEPALPTAGQIELNAPKLEHEIIAAIKTLYRSQEHRPSEAAVIQAIQTARRRALSLMVAR